ncbi:MAG: CHAT domain-containing protein [Nitrospirae bacterium]|nr:CHAT domain-containing protein [Nitrospirota bacterium]
MNKLTVHVLDLKVKIGILFILTAVVLFVAAPSYADDLEEMENQAIQYFKMGKYPEAEPLFKRILEIKKKTLGEEHPDVATWMSNLAVLYDTTGRYAEAEPLYKRAIEIAKKNLGVEHPDVARGLNNLALLHYTTGQYAETEPLFKQALEIDKKTLGEEQPSVAIILNNLAELYRKTGRYAEAEPLLNQALPIAEKSGDPELLWHVRNSMGYLLENSGNAGAAIFFGKQAVNTIQKLRLNVSGMQKETQKSYLGTVEDVYRHLADLLIGEGRFPEALEVLSMLKEEEYFDFIRRDAGKHDNLSTNASFTQTEARYLAKYNEISGKLVSIGKEMNGLQEKLKRGALTRREKERLDVLREDIKAANVAFGKYVTELVEAMKDVGKDRAKEVGEKNLPGLKALQGTLRDLGEGTVVINYLIYGDKVHMLLTTPEIQKAYHYDIKEKELNGMLFAYRQALQRRFVNPEPQSRKLYEILLNPLEADLKVAGAKTLMLSLDGALRYIPFASLHDGESYVVEKYRVIIFTAAASTKLKDQPKSGWTAAGLGLTMKIENFDPLPSVEDELNWIIKGTGKANAGVLPGEIHLDKYFTESVMLDMLDKRRPVLHIASHFVFKPGTDRDSFLLMGDGSHLTLETMKKEGFDFNGLDLLTLSACNTAMGGDGNGREIEGFGALAQNQGAKAVLATLWSVDDGGTAEFMRNMYKAHEKEHLSKAGALQRAQIMFIRGNKAAGTSGVNVSRYGHPYYWAPFILMGNWK